MKHIKEFKVFESSEPEIRREYYPDGEVELERWYLNGERHREEGPARIEYYENGNVKEEWWYLNDKLHRVDGPAWIEYYPDGTVKLERWHLRGKCHRVDGPAEIEYYPDGRVKDEEWYLNDKNLTKAEWVEETPGLSAEELVEISNSDPDSSVRKAARRNPKFPEDLEGWAINLDDWT